MGKKRYFGRYPLVNIAVSKLIFWALGYRRKRLLAKNKKIKRPVVFTNSIETKNKLDAFLENGYKKLSIGGGQKNLEGFVNIDFVAHKNVEREVVANILDLNFISDESIQYVHSNHLVEHLTPEQLENQLQQYYRILEPNGMISVRCPNVLGVSYGFFFEVIGEKNRESFLKLGYPKEEDFYNPLDDWYHKDLWGFYHWAWADSGNIENQHLNQLTPTKLKNAIEKAGFTILLMTEPETSNLVMVAQKQTAA